MSVRSVIGWRTNGAQGSADTTHGRRGAGPGRRCPIPVASDPSGPPCVPGTGKHPQNTKEALILRLSTGRDFRSEGGQARTVSAVDAEAVGDAEVLLMQRFASASRAALAALSVRAVPWSWHRQ